MPEQTTDEVYLDTTILVELCIKKGLDARFIRRVISEYGRATVAAYALKEFRAGAMSYVVALYNRIVGEANNIEDLFEILDKLDHGGFQRYRQKIAVQVMKSLSGQIPDDEPVGSVARHLRDSLYSLIREAWDDAHELGETIEAIACYDDVGPSYDEETGRFQMPVCWPDPPGTGCCVALHAHSCKVVEKVIAALASDSERETRRRVAALQVTPEEVTRHQCRHLGDLAVVLYAPADAQVLSTNHRDFTELCGILGKSFRNPLR